MTSVFKLVRAAQERPGRFTSRRLFLGSSQPRRLPQAPYAERKPHATGPKAREISIPIIGPRHGDVAEAVYWKMP